MSDIKKYELEEYIPGTTSFEVSLGDIFVVPNNEVLKSIDYVSVSNNGIIQCKKEGSGTTTKFIFTPTSNIKEPNHKYDVTVKFTLTTEINTDENTISVKTRNCFIKLILEPEISDTTSRLHIVNYMGKLSPDEYIKEHRDKDDLDSLVTKKGLITNLKEFGKQVQNKVSNVQVFAIRYDLDGGSWDNGNEGRTSFVNSIAYVAPQPVRLGYTFNGWKIYKIADDQHSQRLNENISVDSMIPVGTNYDALCVADWIRDIYKVICYDTNNEPIFSPSIEYDKNTTLLNASVSDTGIVLPTKAGYTLDYWVTTGKFGQVITCRSDQNLNNVYDQIFEASNNTDTRTIELRPHFEPKVYILNYNLNDGNLEDSNGTINTYKYGTTFTLPVPRRNGYKFEGWTIGGLVHQFVINPTDLENISTDTVDVIASWKEATFHLDFDLQGGIIADNSNYTLKANNPIVLSDPIKPGYILNGWGCSETEGSVTYDNTTGKYTFTPSDTVDHDVTLKAIWEASENAEYTLQTWEETPESTGIFTDADNDTCSYRLIKSETAHGKAGTETNFSKGLYPTGYEIPEGFSLSKIENTTIKGDGTSIVRIYIHRNICNVKIVDEYESTENGFITLYRTSLNEIGSTTESTIPCKFGQNITVYPLFNDTYPTNGYSCTSSGKTVTISGADIKLTYKKKLIKITFDLNNAGSWKVGEQNIFEPNIYSIDIPYNSYIGASRVPSIMPHASIETSSWQIESAMANDIIPDNDIAKHLFTCDTRIRRTYTYKSPKVHIESENYDEDNFGISNVLRPQYYDNDNRLTAIPADLLNPYFDAYRLIGYKYKFGENGTYSVDYITSITRDLWTNEISSDDLYLKAIFKRNEPSLDLSNINITYTDGTLKVELSDNNLKDGATGFYLSTTNPNANISSNNANISSNLGIKDIDHIAEISGPFQTDNNHRTVIIIPEKTFGGNQILGKPYIGTIDSIDSDTKEVSISWIQSYQVYDNQDDATLIDVEFTKEDTESDTKDTTLNIRAIAEKVAITNGDISIINGDNNIFTYNIDNFDNKEHTIQITPIIYDKSGKSAFITYKQSIINPTSTNVLSSSGKNIIELENNKNAYYIKDDINLYDETEAVKNKKLVNNSTYADTINLSGNTSVTSLALGKPISKLKNYYINQIAVTLPEEITAGSSKIYQVANTNARTINFYVNSDLNFLPVDNIQLQCKSGETWSSSVAYSPSISNNKLILTKSVEPLNKIELDLSTNTQVESVTCSIGNSSTDINTNTGDNITKYCITKISTTTEPKNESINIGNAAYDTHGNRASLELNYTAYNVTYKLNSRTDELQSKYSVIKTAVDEALTKENLSNKKESSTYIDSSYSFTTNNINNINNIIIPNNLSVRLSETDLGVSFNTTVTYNYSYVQKTTATYKSKIINKFL